MVIFCHYFLIMSNVRCDQSMKCIFKFLKTLIVKDILPLILLDSSAHFKHTFRSFVPLSETVQEVLTLLCLLQGMTKSITNGTEC